MRPGTLPHQLLITVDLTNCYTAVFTNVVIGCETNGARPFGAPMIFVNGQPATNDLVTVSNFASVAIQTAFPNGRIYYTFDCSMATTNSTNYTGPFTAIGVLTLRALAVSEDGSQIVENCPVTIRVEPHSPCPDANNFFVLEATTFGGENHGGSVRRIPAFTPYPCETVVTVIAEPDIGWSFLGWLGAADGPNPKRHLHHEPGPLRASGLCRPAQYGCRRSWFNCAMARGGALSI